MSLQTKRHVANINDSLTAEYNNLKATKDHLLDHIGGLMKRQKHLTRLKMQLGEQLRRTQQQIKIQQKTKEPLCMFLREQISELDRKYIEGNLRLRNLQNQYQVCLQDYQKVIELVTQLIDGASGIEGELGRLKESDITMKAMIFDCERLKRVLQEEKRYFKELCNSEQKSHAERLKQLQSIIKNIRKQEDSSTCSIRLSKLHIGLMKMGNFFDRKMSNYREVLIRQQTKQAKVVKLGIKTFSNFVNLAESKMLLNKRCLFRAWHNKTFPKSILKDIAERALVANEQSRIRLKTIGNMEQKILQKNTQMLQLYEKIKYVVVIANKCYRKDKHYGFNLWREQSRGEKRVQNILEQAFCRTLPLHLKKQYFRKWNTKTKILERIKMASILLNEFETTKQTARVFRKWRFQILNHQQRYIKNYIRRLQDQEKITKRINYEKRKVKILTTFHMKITKIKLRNYFIKYWANVKQLKAKESIKCIETQKQQFSETRRTFLKQQSSYEAKDKLLLITIFRDFVYKRKLVPVYKQWKNQAQYFKKQKRALLSLVLRKQAKNKIYVMNQFRKCVQYYQKKEMHQILTDLNHKMQTINEKSTQFRESLKNCIENLGIIASKKFDYVINYTNNYQRRMVYNTYNALKIKKAYKLFLLTRMFTIVYSSCGKQTFASIQDYIKQNQKEKAAQKKATNHYTSRVNKRYKAIFQWIKRQAMAHNKGFSMLIHIQNVFIFYRMTYAFAAIKRVYTAQKYKAMHKLLQDQGSVLKQREQNMMNLTNNRKGCQKSLQQFFGKFVNYEDRKRKIKMRQKTHNLLCQYLNKFRKVCHNETIKEKTVQNVGDIVMNHNQFLFFRNLMVIRYEQLLVQVKEELAKINKKRKTFQQKNGKAKVDMEKRIQQEIRVYNQCKQYYQFYTNRYENILNFYSKKTVKNEQHYLKRQIFLMWKYEYVTAKRLYLAIQKVFRRKFLKQPVRLCINEIKGRIDKVKSQQIIADMLQKKGVKLIIDALNLWKVNIHKMKQVQIQKRLDHLDQYEIQMKSEIKQRSQLISMEVPRVNARQRMSKVFMALKQVWLKKITNKRKIQPMLVRAKDNYVKDAMTRWKWLMFYKHTKRSYLKYKKQKYDTQLKRDIFNSLKFYRFTIYNVVNKIKAVNSNQLFKVFHHCFDKIRNVAADERDELNYERRRALFTLLNAKIAKIQRIKKLILMKWNAQLIERWHYLPSIIKRCELNALKRAFANINEKKYWNEHYIKGIAEQVTSDGYNEINQVTNSLMREGYDPDEIKEYLKKRNDKDIVILDKVIKHFRAWSSREAIVRSFHSWKQFVGLKQNIKRALGRVFNIAGGIGKYWSRWRTKDVNFNQILKKQSRGNMLNRYRELSRLLKEYHRDIRDNTVNIEELKEINQQYKQKNKMGIIMGLNTFSNSLKKGLLQGFNLWRDRVHDFRKTSMDERYDQIISGLEMLGDQRSQLRYRIGILREQNKQLKEKCMWGVDCGKILERLLTEKDNLSIDLADKEHNLKLLLEDNLRLKQKMKLAKSHAEKLIRKVQEEEKHEN